MTRFGPIQRKENLGLSGSPQDLHLSCTGFPQRPFFFARGEPSRDSKIRHRLLMTFRSRVSWAFVVCVAVTCAARAHTDATLFRVFFADGTSVVSYGELARVGDQVIFTMPVGGSPDAPTLHAVTLPSRLVDWPRTERNAVSARYQHYAATRGEADYQRLTDQVAALINDIAVSTDRGRALTLAEEARQTLADWPRSHFGYRQHDVRDIVELLDASISRLRAGAPAASRFEVSLVALADPIEIEPVAMTPTAREQLEQIIRVFGLTTNARDRVALMQAGIALINDRAAPIAGIDSASIRRSFEGQLRGEESVDRRYAKFAQNIFASASRAAADARIADVQRVLNQIPKEDDRLGRRRPEVVEALTGSVQAQLEAARRLRLLRDQWLVRQSLFQEYERSVGREVMQLAKARPLLEAIRKLEGPAPERLATLRTRLSGGSLRLERLAIPEYLRATHDLLVGAWRFAESAVNGRSQAVSSGNLPAAWQASSAAAGALMMLSRAEQEIRALREAPKLQ